MAKNLNKLIEVLDMSNADMQYLDQKLNEGYTILVAAEKGKAVEKSLEDKWTNFLNANVELKEERSGCGICGCGKPANVLLYMWR
ncbi:hypothetical protein CK556_03220 [Mesoplasma chauliocola]|uniref:Uncharacterized protein n=1 Tax=Mesoplasma chauliocola TaxID=216427 RepID=A0A249SNZ6_9MOLU|nr:hypothetical protein [Mesoplasma chauliocola]ASZ09340.1 hypothetical protein CK556_03220 [Mesoplasma chauliocola]